MLEVKAGHVAVMCLCDHLNIIIGPHPEQTWASNTEGLRIQGTQVV